MNAVKKPETIILELSRGEVEVVGRALRCYRKNLGDHRMELFELAEIKDALWGAYCAVDNILAVVEEIKK